VPIPTAPFPWRVMRFPEPRREKLRTLPLTVSFLPRICARIVPAPLKLTAPRSAVSLVSLNEKIGAAPSSSAIVPAVVLATPTPRALVKYPLPVTPNSVEAVVEPIPTRIRPLLLLFLTEKTGAPEFDSITSKFC